MPHLTLETLARLVDETPSAAEATHIEVCDACRTTLETLRADVETLNALPPLEPPPSVWQKIANRARAEGLIRAPAQVPVTSWRAGLIRIAASVLIFATGLASGIAFTSIDRRALAPDEATQMTQAGVGPVVDLGTEFLTARQPRNAEEAERLVREVEAVFYYAVSRNADLDPIAPPSDELFTRLAALESMVSIAGTALDQAPADPVLNGFYLTALAQRDASLTKIAAFTANSW
jgi:hypothetical protein